MLQVQRQDVDAFLDSRGVGELPQGVEAWATPHLAKRQAQQDTESGEVQDLEAFQTGKQYLPAALLETCRKRTVTRIACCSDGVQGIAGCKQ